MKLRLKPFEKLTRRRARQQLRKSPADWREFKRCGSWRRRINVPLPTFRFMLPLSLAAFGFSRSVNTLIAVTLLWAIASIAWRAGQLLMALWASPRLLLFAHLPLSDAQVFQLQWRSHLRTSLWTLLDFAIFYGLLAMQAGYGWNAILAGFAAAVPQWFVVLSVSTCLVAVGVTRFYWPVVLFSGALALAIGIIPSLDPIARSLAGLANQLPPTGWILYVMGFNHSSGLLLDWWGAVSLATVSLALPLAFRRLGGAFVVPENLIADERERGPIEAERRTTDDGANPDPCAEIKASIRRREFLSEFNWTNAGWIERLVGRLIGTRDHVAAEFLTGGTPRWTGATIKFLLVSGGLAGVVVCLWKVVPVGFRSIIFIIASVVLRDPFAGFWPGTKLRMIAGSNIALNSIYPVGFWQIARISVKVHLVQFLLLLAFVGVPGTITLCLWPAKLSVASYLGIRCLILAFVLLALAPVALVSSGTNDTNKIRIILPGVVFLILFGCGCAALFFADTPVRLAIAASVLVATSFGALWFYGSAYNHDWFDLQRKVTEPKPEQAH